MIKFLNWKIFIKKFFTYVLVVILTLLFVSTKDAHRLRRVYAQQFDIACPVGLSGLEQTRNPNTGNIKQWVCVDLNGTVLINGVNANFSTLNNVAIITPNNAAGWSGIDAGAWINSAYAALPTSGGEIFIAGNPNTYLYASPILINTSGKPAKIEGSGVTSSRLQYTPATATIAFTLDTGNLTGVYSQLTDFSIISTVSGATATGLSIGPTNGAKQAEINHVYVSGFKSLIVDTSQFTNYKQVRAENCSSAASSIGYSFNTPGDDPRWYGGDIGGCVSLTNIPSPVNGPVTFFGTDFFAGATTTTFLATSGNGVHVTCIVCHFVNGVGLGIPLYFTMNGVSQLDFISTNFENDVTSGSTSSWATASAGNLNFINSFVNSAGATATTFVNLSGTVTGSFIDNNIASSAVAAMWNTAYVGGTRISEFGTTGATTSQDFFSGHLSQFNHPFASACTMSAGTTCTFSVTQAYASNPLCFTNIDRASAPPATAINATCAISGTTVTITAGATNSLTWDAILIGNPN